MDRHKEDKTVRALNSNNTYTSQPDKEERDWMEAQIHSSLFYIDSNLHKPSRSNLSFQCVF